MKTVYPKEWTLPQIKESLPRNVDEVVCECGGIAHKVSLTKTEMNNLHINCGRSYECCGRAFVCEKCGTRMVGKAETPDME